MVSVQRAHPHSSSIPETTLASHILVLQLIVSDPRGSTYNSGPNARVTRRPLRRSPDYSTAKAGSTSSTDRTVEEGEIGEI